MIAAAVATYALISLLTGKFGEFVANAHNIFAAVVKVLGMIFYMLSYIFYLIIDFLEITFKRIIGLKGTYAVKVDGAYVESSDDLVLTIIKSKTIANIFLALSIIALFLLFISVIVAIIRSEYNWDKQGNSKGPIFGKALKAAALYLTVPVACMFGVWGASKLLKALDEATSGGDETFISSMIFACAAQSGNRLNSDALWEALSDEVKLYDSYNFKGEGKVSKNKGVLSEAPFASRFARFSDSNTFMTALGPSNSADVQAARAQVREDIDNAFRSSYGANISTMAGDGSGTVTEGFYYGSTSWDAYKSSWARDADGDESSTLWLIRGSVPANGNVAQVCSPYALNTVYFYYGLIPGAGGVGWGFNHILSILCAFMILKVLFDITMGVMKRSYELVVLYVISPPVVALMPLDDGSAYKSWCKSFIGKTLMAYGGVLAINFFFMLVPIFSTIKIFTTSNGLTGAQALFFGGGAISKFFDMLVQLLFVLAGAFSLSSLSQMISGIIGAEDAAASGSQISGAVGGMVGKIGGLALGGAAAIAKGAVKMTSYGADKKNAAAEKAAKAARDKEINELTGSDDPSKRMLGEQMKQTDALNAIKASGGGGGGGKPKDDGMGSGKLANFVRNHVQGGAVGAAMKGIKTVGSLYGNALNNATGGNLQKGYESGQKTAAATAAGLHEAVKGIGTAPIRSAQRIKARVRAGDVKEYEAQERAAMAKLGITSLENADGTIDIDAARKVQAEMRAAQSASGKARGRALRVENMTKAQAANIDEAERLQNEAAAHMVKATTDYHNLKTEGVHSGTITVKAKSVVKKTGPKDPKRVAAGKKAAATRAKNIQLGITTPSKMTYSGKHNSTTTGTTTHEERAYSTNSDLARKATSAAKSAMGRNHK